MAARLGARESIITCGCFAGRFDGVEDSTVSRTSAQVPVERLGDRRSISGLSLFHQRGCTDHDAGNAEAALDSAFEDEGIAHPLANILRQAFERDDLPSLGLLGLPETRQRGR